MHAQSRSCIQTHPNIVRMYDVFEIDNDSFCTVRAGGHTHTSAVPPRTAVA
jgi:hypothetical protein